MDTIVNFSDRQLATVLAALRTYQCAIDPTEGMPSLERTDAILAIAGPDPLSPAEIDALCETMNTH